MTDIPAWPALEIARAVREARVSPAEVVQAHLSQITRLEPGIHAFQVVLAEQAMAEAHALADRADLTTLRGRRAALVRPDRLRPAGHS